MKRFFIRSLHYPIPFLLLLSFSSIASSADIMSLSDRKDRWEIAFQSNYLDSQHITFDGGADATINEEYSFGFGIGYNFSEHWALDFNLNWGDVGFSGNRILEDGSPEPISGNLFTNSMLFTGIYNFSAKRFTPFVGATLGWTFIDSNIPNGPPQNVCWWDPWWGYICGPYQPTHTTTELTYGASAGFRFDVKDNLFLRLSAAKKWIDFSRASNSTDFTSFRFDIGLMF